MFRQSAKYAMLLGVTVALGACTLTGTKGRATLAEKQIVSQVCKAWTPITDTTSAEVRGNNRAHYVFCTGPLPKEKAK